MTTRRHFVRSTAALGACGGLPFALRAQGSTPGFTAES